MKQTVIVYRDRRREWRWTLLAANGNKLACSGEGYTRRAHALTMARRLFPNRRIVVD